MSNKSGITPVGHVVMVLPDSVEMTTESGLVVMTETQADREELGQTDGLVVAISDEAIQDRFKVGDRVIMTKYAGMIRVGNDGVRYRLINDTEIKAIIADKENDE